jgi:transposase
VRVTTAFKRLLALDAVNVTAVEFGPSMIVVSVALRRRRLECPHCDYSTRWRYDTRPVPSRWRLLDVGVWPLELAATLRRLRCPDHGVVTEAVPVARPGANLTRELDDLIAWLATRMDKTAIARLCRVSWRTVGRVCERVAASELDPVRLDGLFRIGVDEISWRKHHKYLTLVVDHDGRKVVWGAAGHNAKTLDEFFNELGPERAAPIEAVSMDLGGAYLKSVTGNLGDDVLICADIFLPVALATTALDRVRRPQWQELRHVDADLAKKFKGARWALVRNPEDLTDRQAVTLNAIRRNGGAMWRAYTLKEAFRAIFDHDLDPAEELLDRWCAWALRSRLAPFVKLARTIRRRREHIINALRLGLTNGRVEGLNNRVRLIVRRAYGFHSADAALGLVMLSCGPIDLKLPHEKTTA